MKHLKYYNTTAEYTADAPNRTNPTISYDNGGKKIHVDEVIYTSDTKRETWNIYFVDVDGTVLSHQYVEEGGDIEYPADPTHEGYTFVGWNQTATTANATDFYDDGVYKMIVIGPMYELTDAPEDTTFDCLINVGVSGRTYGVRLSCTDSTGITINWGDGSTSTSTATAFTNYTHTYTTSGKYTITIHANSGTYILAGTSSAPFMLDFRRSCTEATIGTSCTKISSYTFVNCYNIKKVKMHKDLVIADGSNFYSCYNLQEIIFPTCLTSVTTNIFLSCYNLSSVIFPKGFTSILNYIGGNMSNNRFVSIPNTLTKVAPTYPFSEGSYLTAFSSVIFKPSKDKVVFNYSTIETVYDYDRELTVSAKTNDTFLTKVTIPSTATSIPYNAFCNCFNLREVNFNNSITVINSYGFRYCYSLKKADIPNTVTVMSPYSFYYCYSLEDVTIPNTLTSLTSSLFTCCYKLKNIELPSTIKILNGTCFGSCVSLKTINLPNGLTSIGGSVFQGCCSLNEITIPETVTVLSGSTFLYCYSLSHVNFNTDIGYIQTSLFNACNALMVLEFGDNLTKVPRFGASTSSTTPGTSSFIYINCLTFIVVPDALYDDWYASSYWTTFKPFIIKRSDYNTIIGTT